MGVLGTAQPLQRPRDRKLPVFKVTQHLVLLRVFRWEATLWGGSETSKTVARRASQVINSKLTVWGPILGFWQLRGELRGED